MWKSRLEPSAPDGNGKGGVPTVSGPHLALRCRAMPGGDLPVGAQAVRALFLHRQYATPRRCAPLCRPEAGGPSRPRALSPSAVRDSGSRRTSPGRWPLTWDRLVE